MPRVDLLQAVKELLAETEAQLKAAEDKVSEVATPPSDHPSADADDYSEKYKPGERTQENLEDLKKNVPANVEESTEREPNQRTLGKEPQVAGEFEVKTKDKPEDPGTKSPARFDKQAGDLVELIKRASDLGEEILKAMGESLPGKEAADQSDQVEAKEASDSGKEDSSEEDPRLDLAAELLQAQIKAASDAADMTAEYLMGFFEAKRAADEMAAAGLASELNDALAALSSPPGGLPVGPEVPPEVEAAAAEAAAEAPAEEEEPEEKDEEELLDALVEALVEAGVTPEELAAALEEADEAEEEEEVEEEEEPVEEEPKQASDSVSGDRSETRRKKAQLEFMKAFIQEIARRSRS